jgi:biofilm PGA synthesis N-glycosyltransferase PgaC
LKDTSSHPAPWPHPPAAACTFLRRSGLPKTRNSDAAQRDQGSDHIGPEVGRESTTNFMAMMLLEVIFWVSAASVFYTFFAYPLILAAAARLRPRGGPVRGTSPNVPVSVVIAAYNEEAQIGSSISKLSRLTAALPSGGELIVVSDGSTDRTIEVAQVAANRSGSETRGAVPFRLITLLPNGGKAAALNAGWAAASYPLVVFADARQSWAPDAIERILENFADPAVGAVSGDLVVESATGLMAGFSLYWRFEKWLRRTESRFDSSLSVSGSICAVRRELFRPIPSGTILDDVYWPLQVVMGGHRVIHDERAHAYDRLPMQVGDEFRRKVRTLCGNFQLVARLPSALLPWRNPVWWQFVSHRLLRLLMPWALIGLGASVLVLEGPVYQFARWVQAAFCLLAIAGISKAIATRSTAASAAAAFVILNTAAWTAFWVWISGRTDRSWGKVAYDVTPTRDAAPDGVRS